MIRRGNILNRMKTTSTINDDFTINSVINITRCIPAFDYVYCCICLNILSNPVTCVECNAFMCDNCYTIMKINGKYCFGNCPGDIRKPNRFVRELLSDLILYCPVCDMEFKNKDLNLHKHFNSDKQDIIEVIKAKDNKIKEISDEIDTLRTQIKMYTKISSSRYLKMSKKDLRKHLITNTLSVKKKMELYHTTTNGNLEEFKRLIITKGYPLLEEISCPGYYWTCLHYAMHYGKYQVISFIFNELLSENLLEPSLKLESNDGRCPMLCLFKSNCLTHSQKEEIFDKILSQYSIEISPDVKKEAVLRKLDNVLKRHSKL